MKIKESLLGIAEVVDAYRVFPRVFTCGYGAYAVFVGDWFMQLKDPSTQQAGFAGAIVALCGPILNWYMKTGRNWTGQRTEE